MDCLFYSDRTATFLREKSPKRLWEKLRFSLFGDVVAVFDWGAPEGAVKAKGNICLQVNLHSHSLSLFFSPLTWLLSPIKHHIPNKVSHAPTLLLPPYHTERVRDVQIHSFGMWVANEVWQRFCIAHWRGWREDLERKFGEDGLGRGFEGQSADCVKMVWAGM